MTFYQLLLWQCPRATTLSRVSDQAGVQHLIVTMGCKGALLATREAFPYAPAEPQQATAPPLQMRLWHLPVRPAGNKVLQDEAGTMRPQAQCQRRLGQELSGTDSFGGCMLAFFLVPF